MGRQLSRQQRRALARRTGGHPPSRRVSLSTVVGIALVTGVLALLAMQVFGKGPGKAATPSAQAAVIDGIKCAAFEGQGYHVHSHLTIFDKGRNVGVPGGVGVGGNCLYWLHAHDPNGVIHIEAPQNVRPTLITFFHIWGAQLSRKHVADVAVKPADKVRAYVNQRIFNGNPQTIKLASHADITLEVGPPFKKPARFHFGKL